MTRGRIAAGCYVLTVAILAATSAVAGVFDLQLAAWVLALPSGFLAPVFVFLGAALVDIALGFGPNSSTDVWPAAAFSVLVYGGAAVANVIIVSAVRRAASRCYLRRRADPAAGTA